MSAITCKYMGPTNHRGSRILLSSGYDKMLIPLDGRYGFETNCEKAVEKFLLRYDYEGTWIGSHSLNGMVFVPAHSTFRVTVGVS